MNPIVRFINWTLNSRVNPLCYLTAYVSAAIGLFFAFFTSLPDVQNSLLYQYGTIVDVSWWGFALFISATCLLVGLKVRKRELVRVSSMVTFVLWAFAFLTYLDHQFWYALATFALFHLLVQGYFYLAASLDLLWDR